MIDWNKYFEHIIVLTRCSSFDRRKKLDEQFKKLNITNYQYWYNFDEDFSGESKIFKKNENDILIGHQRTSFGHYIIWKTYYELGYDNVLIIEDDITFIDDIDMIQKMLDKYQKLNSNIYLFDWAISAIIDNILTSYTLCTCYKVDKKGLKYLIKQHEKYNSVCDQYFIKYNKEFFKENNIEKYSFYKVLNKNYTIFYSLDEEDLSIDIDISPTRICYQPDKV